MVFHAPQLSHLPAQRLWIVPQFWQMNCVRALAIGCWSQSSNAPLFEANRDRLTDNVFRGLSKLMISVSTLIVAAFMLGFYG